MTHSFLSPTVLFGITNYTSDFNSFILNFFFREKEFLNMHLAEGGGEVLKPQCHFLLMKWRGIRTGDIGDK